MKFKSRSCKKWAVVSFCCLVSFLLDCSKENLVSPIIDNQVYGSTDIDGNIYKTVIIGKQEWMAENLRVTRYNDGTEIHKTTDNTDWENLTNAGIPVYSYLDGQQDEASKIKYGALYNYYVANPSNPKKIAPAGWHVPDTTDWNTLRDYLIANKYNWDGTSEGNKIAKALAAQTDWWTYSDSGTIGCDLSKNNSSGFSAFPAGERDLQMHYQVISLGESCCWWTSTAEVGTFAYQCYLQCDIAKLGMFAYSMKGGHSVRLVKNQLVQ
jgi:uncharacterized protein (TIGR02145 family)